MFLFSGTPPGKVANGVIHHARAPGENLYEAFE